MASYLVWWGYVVTCYLRLKPIMLLKLSIVLLNTAPKLCLAIKIMLGGNVKFNQ